MDEVPGRIEHTVLDPTTTRADATDALDAAMRAGTAVCLPPSHVATAAEYAPSVDLTTVVGSPTGQHTTETKITEARTAWEDGADRLAMVPNLGLVCAGEDDAVGDEIEELVAAVPVPVRVVLERSRLSEDECERAASAASETDAAELEIEASEDGDSATVAAVESLSRHLPVAVRGIDTWERARTVFEAGAERIGSPNGGVVVSEYRAATDGGE